MTALRKHPRAGLTVAEFQAWQPPEHPQHRWQLVDGEPVAMAPASVDHGTIQNTAAYLLTAHLLAFRPLCRVVIAPGVVPRVRSLTNERVPDLAVTCGPPTGGPTLLCPTVLLEILSPSNAAQTRANVWAYTTIPSVSEILLLNSTAIEAELWQRDASGSWPEEPLLIAPDSLVTLSSVRFSVALTDFYRGTTLVT